MKNINLKKTREIAKITAREVAEYFGKTIKTIYRWESGETPISDFYKKEYIKFLDRRKNEK
jgi:transcriptional regulator with XRE-family HTH domain